MENFKWHREKRHVARTIREGKSALDAREREQLSSSESSRIRRSSAPTARARERFALSAASDFASKTPNRVELAKVCEAKIKG
jgi:hypothetical protein